MTERRARAPDPDFDAHLERIEAARRSDTPPWPADDPPPYLPPMDPTFTWSTSDLEAIERHREWMARQEARAAQERTPSD